jgi:hypothetical protein
MPTSPTSTSGSRSAPRWWSSAEAILLYLEGGLAAFFLVWLCSSKLPSLGAPQVNVTTGCPSCQTLADKESMDSANSYCPLAKCGSPRSRGCIHEQTCRPRSGSSLGVLHWILPIYGSISLLGMVVVFMKPSMTKAARQPQLSNEKPRRGDQSKRGSSHGSGVGGKVLPVGTQRSRFTKVPDGMKAGLGRRKCD